jgi:peptidoglycan/xylan/chitin deacetylase (PgdA/CDA1 family)
MASMPILNFHGIGVPHAQIGAEERRYWISAELFSQIIKLTSQSRKPCAYTFDDGNLSDLEIAMPELVAAGITAAFFVLTGRIGRPNYLDAQDIRRLADAGMTIGLHGKNHVDWRACDDKTFEEETTGARKELEAILGQSVDSVAIPFGAYNKRILARLTALGFRSIYTSDGGFGDPEETIIPRMSLRADMDAKYIKDVIAGKESMVKTLRKKAAMILR